MLRLSFIVPFYNVEPYIEECIRSLYNQDIPQEEYEVICIDDCSPDGSRAIVERLQQEYPTLKLLRTPENLRQGGARNMGLDIAQGKYIWFVDSDDVIKSKCLGELLELAEKNQLDVLPFYFDFYDNPLTRKQIEQLISYGPTTGSKFVFDAPINIPPVVRCCSAVQQIIKRNLILDNHIQFVEKKQFEDDDYAYQIFALAKRTMLAPSAPYIVRTVTSSTTHKQYTLQKILDITAQHQRMIDLVPKLKAYDERWEKMIQGIFKWSLYQQILMPLKSLSFKEQVSFYIHHVGWLRNLRNFATYKTYLAMHFFVFWKLFY